MQRLILMMMGVAAIGVWLVAEDGVPEPPEPLPVLPVEAGERGSAETGELEGGEPERIDTAPFAPDVSEDRRGPGAITGRLLDARGVPVGQAGVSLRQVAGRPRSYAELLTHTTLEGHFDFPGLALGTWMIDADDGHSVLAKPRRVDIPADAASVALELRLASGHRISGSVRSAGGDPLAGLQVTLGARRSGGGKWVDPLGGRCATSDERGRFEFEGLRPGRLYHLEAENPQHFLREGGGMFAVTFQGGGSLRVSGDTEVELVMGRYATLVGRLEDPEGRPVSGAEVELAGSFAASSDDTGAFVIEQIRYAEGPMELVAATPDGDLRIETEVTLGDGECREGFVLSLLRSARVSGRITDFSGRGVAGATVVASGTGDSAFPSEFMVNGRHVIGRKALRTALRARANKLGGAFAVVWHARNRAANGVRHQPPELDEAGMGRGVRGERLYRRDLAILREEFAAAAGISEREVGARGFCRTNEGFAKKSLQYQLAKRYRWVQTDAEGCYEIFGLVPGAPYALDVVAEGFLASKATPLSVREWGAEERVDRVLSRGIIVRGTTGATFDAASSRGTFDLELIDRDSNAVRLFKLPAAETYQLADLLPGRYRLRAKARELVALVPDLCLEADGIYEGVNLRFERGACVSGRVSDSLGRSVAGALLVLQDKSAESRLVQDALGGCYRVGAESHIVRSDLGGCYRIGGLYPGSYRLELRAQESPRAESVAVTLLEGQELVHDFAPQPGIAVSGITEGPDGRPLEGVHISLHGPSRISTTSDDNGRFRIADVPPAAYLLFAGSAKGRLNMTRELVLQREAGEEVEVAITVRPCLSLRGRVDVSSGSTPQGKVVALFAGDPSVRSEAQIAWNGIFVIQHLYPGRYELTVANRESVDPTHVTLHRRTSHPLVVLTLRD